LPSSQVTEPRTIRDNIADGTLEKADQLAAAQM